ncbi:MAG: CHRD domain-containing protein [Gemmatimonadaceae bacterium]
MNRAHAFPKLFLFSVVGSAIGFLACGDSTKSSEPTPIIASITVSASSTDPVLSFSDTRTISAVAKDANQASISSPNLTWSSSAPAVATVVGTGTNATVTAVGNGTATITASNGAVQGATTVTVSQKATAITITGTPAFMAPAAQTQLTADARDAKGKSAAGVTGFVYSSSNQNVAVITPGGFVTAITPGITTITSNATVNGATLSGTAVVTVAFPVPNATSATVAATEALAFNAPTVTIGVGGSVTWAFGTVTHNVSFSAGAGAPTSIGNTASASVSRTFATAGSYPYHCTLHSGMSGTVVVQNSTAPGFTALLNGANERPNSTTSTGAGAASFFVTGNAVSYTVTFAGLSAVPIMAHIHAPGNSTQAVGVLVDFPTAGQTLNNGVLVGTFNASNIRSIAGAAPMSLDSLFVLMRNGNAYVNVHTPQFPAGEIRGQIGVP